MTKTALHTAIEAIAGVRGGMCLSAELIQATVLDSLLRAVNFGLSAPVLFPTGNDLVVGRFKTVSIDPKLLTATLENNGEDFFVKVGPDFTCTVILQTATEPALEYCEIELSLNEVILPVEGEADFIHIRSSLAPISAQVSPSQTRDDAMKLSGITADDLLRVEGSVAYVAGARLVNSALGEVPSISLKKLFPALSFGGLLELHNIEGSLLVIPESFALIGNAGCPKGDATLGVQIVPQNPRRGGDGVTWQHNVTLPPPRHLEFVATNSTASVYLPKTVLDVHFGKTTPSVSYRDSGNGFIGHDIQVTAAIRGITVKIEPDLGALRLALDFATWGMATANIDVPCVGRTDLAQAKFQMPKDNGTGTVEALLRLAIDTGGRLLVVCELTRLELGDAQVDVQLFSKYLGMAGGKGAVIGFIIDAVIGRALANNLPGIVFDAIKEAVNQNFFVLADLSRHLKYLSHVPNKPTFSGDQQSALMGLTYNG